MTNARPARPDFRARPAGVDDAAAWIRLGLEAYAVAPPVPAGDGPPSTLTEVGAARGLHPWVLERDGEALARTVLRDEFSWWGGRAVPTAGVAGVAVAPEARGGGLLGTLLAPALDDARERGLPISTLFPTAPGLYRGLGYEVVSALLEVQWPTSAWSQVPRAAAPVTLERVDEAGYPQVQALYARWSARHNGPLRRDSPLHADEGPGGWEGDDIGGLTLARDADGTPVGYVTWERSGGYRADGLLTVWDLVAETTDAARELARFLGSFAMVAPTTRVRTSGGSDDLELLLPGARRDQVTRTPYMLAVLDVPAALEARGYPRWADTTLTFAVQDERFVLELRDGRARVAPATVGRAGRSEVPRLTRRGLALRYAGAAGSSTLRAHGHLTGPDADDELWDAVMGGRQVHIRNYF